MPEISIIIVNYKTPLVLVDCIQSIYQDTKDISYEIIVVDNNSEDNSMDLVTSKFEEVIWIQNEQNEGFGRANNIGIEKAIGAFILLLNSDTILKENAIQKMLEKAKIEGEDFGAATCQLINPDGSKQKSTFSKNASFKEILGYNVILDKLLPSLNSQSNEINAIHGACMIFKKSAMSQIGFFDTDFFLYSEEFEWCYRMKKAGKTLKFYPDIQIIHLEEGSSISKKWNVKQRYLSTALLFKKTKGNLGFLLFIFLHLFNTCSNFLILWKMDKNFRSDFFRSQSFFWKMTPWYFKIFFNRYKKPLKLL